MSEIFTPLVTTPNSTTETSMLSLTVLSQAEVRGLFEPLPAGGKTEPSPKSCTPPSVTLQKQGDVVSSIRIECGCGQVIELACAY